MIKEPKRPQTYNVFLSRDHIDLILKALDSLDREYVNKTVTDVIRAAYVDLRRRVVTLRDAIKRREVKELKLKQGDFR
jgi:hypothetical protein